MSELSDPQTLETLETRNGPRDGRGTPTGSSAVLRTTSNPRVRRPPYRNKKILDQKIQMITSYLFRTIGPILLRGGLGLSGGGGGGGSSSDRGSSSDDDDDFDFDDDDDADAGKDTKPKVSISLPTFPPSVDDDDDTGSSSNGGATTGAPSLRLGGDDDRNEVRKRDNERIDLLAAGPFTTTDVAATTGATETNLV